MQRDEDGTIFFTATDVANHLGCTHLSLLDRAHVVDGLSRPLYRDPLLEVLRERGLAHERQYIEELGAGQVINISDEKRHAPAEARTRVAMDAGAAVIVQGALSYDRFRGRPDVLLRVERKSDAWAWSYEVHDTKLTENTRAGAILQLCLYWRALARIQGIKAVPSFFIKTPTHRHEYRALDYTAYFDMVCARLVATVDANKDPPYPEPVEQCDVCNWWQRCNDQRRDDDHLGFVARSTRAQRTEFRANGIHTLTVLGETPEITFTPKRGRVESYDRVRAQAAIQLRGARSKELLHEPLDPRPASGFALLPEPTEHDVYIDFEGDQFALPFHRDYLLGVVDRAGKYVAFWALTAEEERPMFERVITWLERRLEAHPKMHVYHYAHYENSAFKRLAQRYGVQQDALDKFLRGERFVDLYKVVSQSIRASVESYSIKEIEKLAGFQRKMPLEDAGKARRRLEFALETGRESAVSDEDLDAVKRYNEDDCQATRALHTWLERRRTELGVSERPPLKDLTYVQKEETRAALDAREALRKRLLEGVPDVRRSSEQQTRWLAAQLLDFHRRERNCNQWEKFHRIGLCLEGELEELLDDKEAIAYLKHEGELEQTKRGIQTHRYSFPRQDCDIKKRDKLAIGVTKTDAAGKVKLDTTMIGEVVAVDYAQGTIDIKKTGATNDVHPVAVFTFDKTPTRSLEDALAAVGQTLLDNGDDAAIRLLRRLPPRVDLTPRPGEPASDCAIRVATELKTDVLPIQGPPGAGKTYTAARMIAALVAAKKRIGVTSNSHKAIRNLLKEVHDVAPKIRIAHRCEPEDFTADDGIDNVKDADDARAALQNGDYDLLGGTAWVWAGQNNLVNVLFVDEAGQMALANVLAAATAADSLVLLGDPQQLEQPTKASHPDGVAVSALEHLFEGAAKVPTGRGIFLDVTYRLAPRICDFTSEVFYEATLKTAAKADALSGCGPFDGTGLWLVPEEHTGNRSASDEEVETTAAIVDIIRRGTWRGAPMTDSNIMVIAPYNAQVTRLKARLDGIEVGTVDLFQGREAAVVIFSLATSSIADAPRGMDFLFSGNRLNVATSRAKAVCIVVANPALFAVDCRTPEQIKLANAFCKYREQATVVEAATLRR